MSRLNLERIELREIEMPLKSAFETSFGVTTGRRVTIVRVFDRGGATGYGECTAMEFPFYNPETVDTAWAVMNNCIGPLLRTAQVGSAGEVATVLAPIQGNRMAIAAIETAIWDLEAKMLNTPLWRHIGGSIEEIDCGVSIGLQGSPEAMVEKVSRELESGYQRIKIKIKPGQDVKFVEAVRKQFPHIALSVDANSAYGLEADIDTLKALDEFNLLMIEQPLTAGDLLDHSKLQNILKTRICLDESITTPRDASQALEIDACRIINIKLGRVGGHAAARRIHDLAKAENIPVWCGGMLETGIGRAHNIAMSTLDGFTLPGDISASARYWDQDIIEPAVTVSAAGKIKAPADAGIGWPVNEPFIESLVTRRGSIDL